MSPVEKTSNRTAAFGDDSSKAGENGKLPEQQVGGVSDQYSDGIAAKLWQLYIGESTERTKTYKSFLVNLLRDANVKNVCDAACGTGVDSVMLLEEGFEVVSSDFSDKMLKTAYQTRWARRREPIFDRWVIEEGNWLSLNTELTPPEGGFDALICMGNSFAHLPDSSPDQKDHIKAIQNFHSLIKPGGILVIDHRNYDYILDHGHAPKKNIYYNSKHIKDIQTSILYVNNKPDKITLDYTMNVPGIKQDDVGKFQLSYYPHRLAGFSKLLKSVFGEDAKLREYADFKPIEEEPAPAFYIHVIQKPF